MRYVLVRGSSDQSIKSRPACVCADLSLLGLGTSDADMHRHGDGPHVCVMDPPTHRDVKPSKVVSGVGVSRAHVCAAVAVKTNAWQT